MREIKFRAMSLNTKHWVYGELHLMCKHPHIHTGVGMTEPIDISTIGQFTGLKDKDGREIYEGDILRFPPKSQWDETNYSSFEVFFHDGDCSDYHIGYQMNRAHYHGSVCGTTFWPFQPKWTEKMVIDGNIHERPYKDYPPEL